MLLYSRACDAPRSRKGKGTKTRWVSSGRGPKTFVYRPMEDKDPSTTQSAFIVGFSLGNRVNYRGGYLQRQFNMSLSHFQRRQLPSGNPSINTDWVSLGRPPSRLFAEIKDDHPALLFHIFFRRGSRTSLVLPQLCLDNFIMCSELLIENDISSKSDTSIHYKKTILNRVVHRKIRLL